ncbi:hypothetical protein GCM10010440_61610 [Kitasatospora cinereorecta]
MTTGQISGTAGTGSPDGRVDNGRRRAGRGRARTRPRARARTALPPEEQLSPYCRRVG